MGIAAAIRGSPASRLGPGLATSPARAPGRAAPTAAPGVLARPARARVLPRAPGRRRPRPGRVCLRYRRGERGQELRASLLQVPASAGVVRVWSERGDLIGAPYAQWHRGEDLLELAVVGGGEQPEGAPLAWLERRTPQPEQVSGRRELVRAGGLTSADVADRFL